MDLHLQQDFVCHPGYIIAYFCVKLQFNAKRFSPFIIPGINLAASVINAITAGVIVACLGEGSIYAFEQIYLGNKTTADIDWIKKVMESQFAKDLVEKAKPYVEKLSDSSNQKEIVNAVMNLITDAMSKDSKE